MDLAVNNNVYNTYDKLNLLPYNIVVYLLTQSDDFWKLLNYTTPDALFQPNLTLDQKRNLIYGGQTDSTPYRVFFNALNDDAFNQEVAMVRLYISNIMPTNRIMSDITFGIDVLSHFKIIQLNDSYHSTRTLKLMQTLLSTLNGKDIDGVGRLSFDRTGSILNKANLGINNARNYEGYSIMISCHLG